MNNYPRYKACKAFAMLEIMLATMLLVGLVYLIMHAMSSDHRARSDQQLGTELSVVISHMIEAIDGSQQGTMNLINDQSNAKICPNKTKGLLDDVPSSYLDSMQISNFSLCNAVVNIQAVQITQ